MNNWRKRTIAFILSMAMTMVCFPANGIVANSLQNEVPSLAYRYSFEDVVGQEVKNDISGGSSAQLGDSATVVRDDEKGSLVLNLPGGPATTGSWLTLPNDLFSQVSGEDGFAISMEVKPSAVNGHSFSRIFSASPNVLGGTERGQNGGWDWLDPEFAILRGGSGGGSGWDYNLRMFSGTQSDGKAQYGVDTYFTKGLETDTWQRLIVTMKEDDYAVYLNGRKVGDLDSSIKKRFNETDITEALKRFFEPSYIDKLIHCAIGQSLYTSDENFAGQVDEFRFYNSFLGEVDIAKIEGPGNPTELIQLINTAKAIEKGNYTTSSYNYLQVSIVKMEDFLTIKPCEGQLEEAVEKLQVAIDGLKEKTLTNNGIAFEYNFEAIEDNKVVNSITNIADATLGVTAQIVDDEEKGSKVLNLMGGDANSGSWLTLPDTLFSNIEAEEGLTIAMEVNPAEINNTQYTRLFCTSSYPLGGNYNGHNGNWVDPEFAITRGGGDYNIRLLSGRNGAGIAKDGLDIKFEKEMVANEWQTIIITMKGDTFAAYIDGSEIAGLDSPVVKRLSATTVSEGLSEFFKQENLNSLVYNSLGQGLYTSDKNFTGKIDNFRFFNKFLTREEVMDLVGEEYNTSLISFTIDGEIITMPEGTTHYKHPVSSLEEVETPKDIILGNSNAIYEIEKVDSFTYCIKVTSPNGKSTTNYYIDFADSTMGPLAIFDMSKPTGPIQYGATGFLYGMSEPNIPTVDLLGQLKPQVMVQKAPDGLQHPSGDGTRTADTILEANPNIDHIEIYVQDTYYQWPYEYKGLEDYKSVVRSVLEKAKQDKNKDKYVYVLFNEPDKFGLGVKWEQEMVNFAKLGKKSMT
ncbi:hypothetical protein CS063_14755 [Sporanaerobium hydrogeniformans]|uniref:Uncharacterized protein n=1 Tax=Sporanaerobium hydrogeniformans TaxID=3072179 RepID=A0AC61D9T3_9FIRM|nr:LamG-like jellyroll fold domain-containing protein [Sporanaerobium hydrogeniformans]PHV69620.1 hypothetical protein CS063_14755 [Sporanaerobium hydrogeniformans]